jgi:DNA-binding NtrC family response regulator
MPRNTILSAGRDRPLLYTRNRVLEEAGYIVTSAITTAEIVEKFFAGDFDLIILCHSIPQDERQRIATLAHNHSPSTPVMVLADMASRRYEFGDLTVYSEATTLLESIPEALKMAAERKPSLPAPARPSASRTRPRRSA